MLKLKKGMKNIKRYIENSCRKEIDYLIWEDVCNWFNAFQIICVENNTIYAVMYDNISIKILGNKIQ